MNVEVIEKSAVLEGRALFGWVPREASWVQADSCERAYNGVEKMITPGLIDWRTLSVN